MRLDFDAAILATAFRIEASETVEPFEPVVIIVETRPEVAKSVDQGWKAVGL